MELELGDEQSANHEQNEYFIQIPVVSEQSTAHPLF